MDLVEDVELVSTKPEVDRMDVASILLISRMVVMTVGLGCTMIATNVVVTTK